ncbi:M15 family metallopeptidase [Maribacter thermophilus]|uniref:M15 family metallopeptidase n=1 Tax=Maribacter thermophilus TaxID=1197874 RepID=UPI000640E0CB|nr:M15 family metallopeptidase [Maribacter thermophilus]
MKYFYYSLVLLLLISCGEKEKEKMNEKAIEPPSQIIDTIEQVDIKKIDKPDLNSLADTTFVRLADYSDNFMYDMRYATENNFLKAKVYDCAECYTRVKTVKALIAANEDFMKKGAKIKFYDCYRPNSVQYKMWDIVPNPQYVANPVKGSIHNKGGAVDITLVNMEGEELDMGTDFDFFGKRAYHDNYDLPQEVLDNRKLLKETMEKHGFWSTRTEWWHYNLQGASKDPIANFKWECDEN